jgi:hypothetical protein
MIQCPACKDYDIHRSKWSGAFERILLLLLRRPVRCYSCYSRFHTWIFTSVKPRGTRYIPRPKKVAVVEAPPKPMASTEPQRKAV